MSKKGAKDTLDEALIGKEEQPTPAPKNNKGEVNLLEYSKNAPFSFSANNYMFLFIGLVVVQTILPSSIKTHFLALHESLSLQCLS